MLKNGSVLYFDRVCFVIFNLGGALFVTCSLTLISWAIHGQSSQLLFGSRK